MRGAGGWGLSGCGSAVRLLWAAALLSAAAALLSAAAAEAALSCWQCGEYSDGVGSITPCLNTSTLRLVACAPHTDAYCIKYVSELSTVRDCAVSCSEKESWGARAYCCSSDGCNASPPRALAAASPPLVLAAALTAFAAAIATPPLRF